MIRPPGVDGVAFTEASDGDQGQHENRAAVSAELGIATKWATVRQVHGSTVLRAGGPGNHGDADAIWTDFEGLPIAVFTADCLGVALLAGNAVGVAHAGWRGARDRVVPGLAAEMSRHGHTPRRAVIGPGIRRCCFEVGSEVAAQFQSHIAITSWGSRSVDLVGVVSDQTMELDIDVIQGCTRHESRWFSHRRNATPERQATIVWQ